MQASLDGWVAQQRRLVMDYARRWGTQPIAIGSMADLSMFYLASRQAGTWTPVPGAKPASAMAFRAGEEVSLWVNPRSNSYVRYYRSFLRSYGVDESRLTERYDVDHLYNRERAIHFGYAYVRMFPVLLEANRSHGGGYESAITEADTGRRVKKMRLMDTVSMLKLHGALSPRVGRNFSIAQQAAIADIAQALGIPPGDVEREIDAMMARAYSR
jgi:hypothetical protein